MYPTIYVVSNVLIATHEGKTFIQWDGKWHQIVAAAAPVEITIEMRLAALGVKNPEHVSVEPLTEEEHPRLYRSGYRAKVRAYAQDSAGRWEYFCYQREDGSLTPPGRAPAERIT